MFPPSAFRWALGLFFSPGQGFRTETQGYYILTPGFCAGLAVFTRCLPLCTTFGGACSPSRHTGRLLRALGRGRGEDREKERDLQKVKKPKLPWSQKSSAPCKGFFYSSTIVIQVLLNVFKCSWNVINFKTTLIFFIMHVLDEIWVPRLRPSWPIVCLTGFLHAAYFPQPTTVLIVEGVGRLGRRRGWGGGGGRERRRETWAHTYRRGAGRICKHVRERERERERERSREQPSQWPTHNITALKLFYWRPLPHISAMSHTPLTHHSGTIQRTVHINFITLRNNCAHIQFPSCPHWVCLCMRDCACLWTWLSDCVDWVATWTAYLTSNECMYYM